jgi:trehalose synthase-fused probable maltokinase
MAGRRRAGRKRDAAGTDDLPARIAAAVGAALPGARWFGGKSRTVTGLTALDHVALPGTAGLLALVQVDYADGGHETYCTPLRPGDDPGTLRDALDDPEFAVALVEHMRAETVVAGQAGTFRFAPTPALAELLPARPTTAKRVTAEQSNTSVIYDRAAILKVYRKLEPGLNPELEITDFLTRQTTFRGAPLLGGSLVYEVPHAEPTTVAVLQAFVPNQGDAWSAARAGLQELFAAEADPSFARTLAAADAKAAAALGSVTGRLHMALAVAPPGAPLAPEPTTPEDVAAWHHDMQARLDRVLGALRAAAPGLAPPAREVAGRVLREADQLHASLGALGALAAERVAKIRVHGDYHLGQVLRTADGFVILDFEGEPARSLAERRAKQCPLKDVAGMLRSFTYAAQAALLEASESAREDPGLGARLGPWAEAWEDGVRAAFLDAYLEETWARGAGFLPASRDRLEAVLRVYEVDKALYEIAYELDHRPAWLPIPLASVGRLAAPLPKPPTGRLRPGEGPFTFVACLELREFVGVRAENERQLAELIEEVPLDSIYFHTHGFFLRHKFVAGAYPNDFANWVAVQVRDRVLAERLAMVDPRDARDLQALREELASVIDEHLRQLPVVPRVVFGEPLDFIQSRIVEIPTGIEVRTLEELREALLEVDLSAVYFHLVESRVRLGRDQNDFAAWFERGLGLPELAARVRALDPYVVTLERTRARLIGLCDEALGEGRGR